MRFWVVFRSERAVSTIFPPYIMPNGTYERIKKIYDTLPLTGADASEKYQFGENLGVRLAARRAKPSLRAGDNGPGED